MIAFIYLPSGAQACEVYWALYSDPCKPAAKSAKVIAKAGEYGIYYFSDKELGSCPAKRLAWCKETPPVYPSPGASPMDTGGGLACGPPSGCGKSFSDLSSESWVYVVDFADSQGAAGWHALSVDSVIRTSSDPAVETLIDPLDPMLPAHCPDVTDADVLVSLAKLAEAIDKGGIPAPSAVNMSFGRKLEKGDATSAECGLDGPCKGGLSCQIAGLMAHIIRPELEEPRRSLAIAAHGNHREPLFPAALADVIHAGMLDLTLLSRAGLVESAFETPLDPNALMPGNGLCLRLPGAIDNVVHETANPAGSSFSASLLTGLLTDAILHYPTEVEPLLDAGMWTPKEVCDQDGVCSFRLRHSSGVTFASPVGAGSDRLYEATTEDLSNCGEAEGMALLAVLEPAPVDPYVAYNSLVDRVAAVHQTAPNSRPCTPCQGCCPSVPSGDFAGFKSFGSAAGTVDGETATSTWIDWVIDLHNGWYLDFSLTLIDLYMRIGSEVLKLNIEPLDLAHIDWSMYDFLKVSGRVLDPNPGEQPSLIAVVSWTPPMGSPEIFWNSTPVIWR